MKALSALLEYAVCAAPKKGTYWMSEPNTDPYEQTNKQASKQAKARHLPFQMQVACTASQKL